MSCESVDLTAAAQRFRCLPKGNLDSIQTYLLCQANERIKTIEERTGQGWDDLLYPASTLNPPGIVGGGTTVGTSNPGGNQLALVLAAAEAFWVPVQMSHCWVPGSRIYPHIHVVPQTNNLNNLTWQLDYSISDINDNFVASVGAAEASVIAANTQYRHTIIPLPAGGVDMSAYDGPSTILRMRMLLTAATESIHIVSFDVHYLRTVKPVDFNPH